jgi:hypothetical protein
MDREASENFKTAQGIYPTSGQPAKGIFGLRDIRAILEPYFVLRSASGLDKGWSEWELASRVTLPIDDFLRRHGWLAVWFMGCR